MVSFAEKETGLLWLKLLALVVLFGTLLFALEQLSAFSDWAGEYVSGGGFDGYIHYRLKLSSDGHFDWDTDTDPRHDACLHNHYSGTAKFIGSELVFESQQSTRSLVGKMVPIRWGTRRYMVESNRMLEFCNKVNSGYEPHIGIPETCGLVQEFYIQDQNLHKIPDGQPTLPAPWNAYLLPQPIKGRIVKMIDKLEGVAEIDLGSRHGLKTGMVLFAHTKHRFTPSQPYDDTYEVEVKSTKDVSATIKDLSPDTNYRGYELHEGLTVTSREHAQ